MKQTLAQICALQPRYSSSNTPEMQERGRLVRTALEGELHARLPVLQTAFDPTIRDLNVGTSDGIGRKTEAPWARVFSTAMSPNPRSGFYLVIHFAADGSAVFVTVGCGSTVWSGGDLRPVSDSELARRTSWARQVVEQRWGSIAPFSPGMDLGAKADLPKTFEKATALAIRISAAELGTADLEAALYMAAERLGEIYLAQRSQRDVAPGEQDKSALDQLVNPLRLRSGRQGFGLTTVERKAVERRAMDLAIEHFTRQGYHCKDTSATESFDLMAVKGDVIYKVEVKGTTSDLCDSVLMTRNEVELHRAEKGRTALVLVYGIRLRNDGPLPHASEGSVETLMDWDIDAWRAEPIAFELHRR
jgi:hypothetical protein